MTTTAQLTNLQNLYLTQLCGPAPFAGKTERTVGVLHVLRGCYPFEVFDSVVGLGSVFMVNVVAITRADECFGDETTRLAIVSPPIYLEHDKEVAAIAKVKRKNVAGFCGSTSNVATDATQARNRIDAFKPYDRLPRFDMLFYSHDVTSGEGCDWLEPIGVQAPVGLFHYTS